MKKDEKPGQVASIIEKLTSSNSIFLVNYAGINVEDISKLRKEFRKEGVDYTVFKNTLVKRALKDTGKYPLLAGHLKGMTGIVFAGDNPAIPAKIIKKFLDDKKKFELKACYIESDFFDGSQLTELSNLPSKAEVIAGVIGAIASPASGIVGSINAVIRELISVIDEVAKTKAA